jgi:hypothetical protein
MFVGKFYTPFSPIILYNFGLTATLKSDYYTAASCCTVYSKFALALSQSLCKLR